MVRVGEGVGWHATTTRKPRVEQVVRWPLSSNRIKPTMQEPDLFKICIKISENLENCQGNFCFVSRLQPSELEVPSPIRDHLGRIKAWIESYGNAWWHRTVLAMRRDAHSNAEIEKLELKFFPRNQRVKTFWNVMKCLCAFVEDMATIFFL